MNIKNRRMLSFLMAIVMVLTMMPFHPLEVKAAPTPTLDLGTPAELSETTYKLSDAEFNRSGVVHASGGYFTVTVNNGSIAVGTLPSGITELTAGITISGIVTDQSTPANRVFNFSGTNTYEEIQAVIQSMTFTQVSGQTQRVTVNVTPGTPLTNGKTSVRIYNGRYFVYVERQSSMTFFDAVTTATNINGHLVEPAADHPEEMLAIASMFKEFKTAFSGKPGWNFISFIGATKTYAPDWNTSVGEFTRYVSTGFETGLEKKDNYEENGEYDHLTLLLDNNNTAVKYLGVNNTHGGSSFYKDPGVIVEYNSGVISNIITATKDVASFSKAPGGVGGGLISWVNVEKSADDKTAVGSLQDLAVSDRTWNHKDAGGTFPYDAAAINFNAGFKATGNGYYTTASFGTTDSQREVFSVQTSNKTDEANRFPWDYGGNFELQNSTYGNKDGKGNIVTRFGSNVMHSAGVGDIDLKKPHLLDVFAKNQEWALSVDGEQLLSDTSNSANFDAPNPTANVYYIGAGHFSQFQGDISEIIVFDRKLGDTEKLKVNSYLAIKYGLTLNGGNTDYLASNGTTKMWTADNNQGYGNRITGIGRDDNSDLLQKQSKSQEQGALVTISVGDAVYGSNAANVNTIDNNLSFFAFSDNGATAKYETTVAEAPGHTLKQLNRLFKVEKSTSWQDQNITLKLDVTDENPDVLYYLVIDGATATDIKLNAAGQATFNSSRLANGSTFTFAKVNKNGLQAKLSEIEGLTADNYTAGWPALQAALDDAEDVLNDPASTQEQVDNALAALEAALAALESVDTKLRAKVDEVQGQIDPVLGSLKEDDYTTSSWAALTQALNNAETLLDTSSPTSIEIGQALSALERARGSLVNLSQLRAKKTQIDAEYLQPTSYTTNSWQVFSQALTEAQTVLADPNATQAEVDEALAKLTAARSGLVPANNGNGNGGPGPSGPSPSKQTITVDVLIGGENPADITKVDIERTTHPDGRITDQVTFTPEKALETAEKAKKTGKNIARIVIPDTKDEVSEVKVDVPRKAFAALLENKIDLEIYTDNAVIHIPYTSLSGLEQDFYFRLVPIRDPDERAEVEQRARTERIVKDMAKNDKINVVARPMTIETNLSSRAVTLTLPLKGVKLPQDEQERQAYLNELVIFIEHTDGDKDLVDGEAVKMANGEFGLRFSIDKFSTFTILHMDGKKQAANRHLHYINGYKDGSFKPNQGTTRAEMATMLVNIGAAKSSASGAKFPDVPASHWAATAVSQADAAGLMKGYPDGRFQPNRKVTRAEMAAIVYQYLKLKQGTASGKFTDVAAKHWANGMISAVVEAGAMEGYSNGTFQPEKELTRAEAVTILNRLFDRGPLHGTESSWSDVPVSHWAYLDIEEASRDHAYEVREQGGEQWLAK